ncbi:hypothetical protein HY643_03545 [Candidatus Woesearchaeota archaeon]|nr:hypothetical protein [Candidatus Woesearchaeota archaeon]
MHRSRHKCNGSFAEHEALKRSIIDNPGVLALEKIISYKEEVPYLSDGRKLGQVDLVLWNTYGQPYIVEVTTSTTTKAKRRIKEQARRAKRYFKHVAGVFSVVKQEGNNLRITKY